MQNNFHVFSPGDTQQLPLKPPPAQVCHWSYMSPLIVTGVNIAGSKFVTKTTEIEGWSPRTEIKVGLTQQTWQGTCLPKRCNAAHRAHT